MTEDSTPTPEPTAKPTTPDEALIQWKYYVAATLADKRREIQTQFKGLDEENGPLPMTSTDVIDALKAIMAMVVASQMSVTLSMQITNATLMSLVPEEKRDTATERMRLLAEEVDKQIAQLLNDLTP